MKRLPLLVIGILILVTVVGGCTSRYARVQVSMCDALPSGIKEINIKVSEIALIPAHDEEESGEIILSTEPKEMNLLALASEPMILSDTSIPAGTYDQIRLVITGSTVVFEENGVETEYPLTIPSAEQSGIKLLLKGAEFEAGAVYGVILDFDARKGFINEKTAIGYKMNPTINAVLNIYSGRIIGKVVDDSDPNAEPVPVAGANVQVSQDGNLVVETATDDTGMFYANALLAGEYDVTITAEGYQTYTTTATVVAKEDTDLSTIALTKAQ